MAARSPAVAKGYFGQAEPVAAGPFTRPDLLRIPLAGNSWMSTGLSGSRPAFFDAARRCRPGADLTSGVMGGDGRDASSFKSPPSCIGLPADFGSRFSPVARHPAAEGETLRPLEHPLAVFAPNSQSIHYSPSPQRVATPYRPAAPPEDALHSRESPPAPRAANSLRASVPPAPLDIRPTFHPSVVTPSSIPDDFTARLPLLTYNPRALPAQHSAVPLTRSGRSCTPVSSARIFFRRPSRPTRPAPRRAELKDRVSPRASSLDPPNTRVDRSEPQHKRAASALLPSKLPPSLKAASKRPSRVPPLPLGKILMSREALASNESQTFQPSQPGTRKRHSDHPSSGGPRSQSRRPKVPAPEAKPDWSALPNIQPLPPAVSTGLDFQQAVSPIAAGHHHWHSRQPTLMANPSPVANSQRFGFADVDSARAQSILRTRFLRSRQPNAVASSSSSSSATGEDADDENNCCFQDKLRSPLAIQRTVHLEWGPGQPSYKHGRQRVSKRVTHATANLTQSSVLRMFVDGGDANKQFRGLKIGSPMDAFSCS